MYLSGSEKIQLIKTIFKNIHTLHFKRFNRDFTCETNMGFTIVHLKYIIAVTGQHCLPELSFANKIRVFFRAKNRRRKTALQALPDTLQLCLLLLLSMFWHKKYQCKYQI